MDSQIDAPKVRTIDWGAMARDAWGDQWSVPEIVYEFSNGRIFQDTGPTHGIYNPLGS